MNKKLVSAQSLVLALLLLMGANVVAGDRDCYRDEDCCEETCCDETALRCGAWNFKVKGGVNPKFFTDRTNTYVALRTPTGDPLPTIGKLPKFDKLFKNPGWIVSGELGYATSDCTETFLEVAYSQNSRQDKAVRIFVNESDALDASFTKTERYQSIAGYLGGRHYWGRWWCDRFAVFVGAKIGVLGRKEVKAEFNRAATPVLVTPLVEIFNKNAVVSGGVQTGFTVCMWERLSFIMAVEVVASGSWKNNQNIPLLGNFATSDAGFTNLVVGQTGTEVSIPVSFGLMWQF